MVSLRKFDRWAVVHFLLLLGLLFLAVAFSGSSHELRLNLQHSVFDQFNRIYPRESTGQVLIVDIDEKSLEAFGQWPWPRDIMARLVDRLHAMEAKVIAFDGVFGEEDRSSPKYLLKTLPEDMARELQDLAMLDHDAMFAESIKKSGIFISAFTYGRTNRKDNRPPDNKRVLAKSNVSKVFLENASFFEAAAVDLPMITKAAAGNGSFMARPDSDGVLRRAGMIFTDRKTLYPSLSLEALRVAFLGRKGTVRLAQTPEDERREIDTEYRIAIGDMVVPVEGDGIINVYYRYFCNEDDLVRKRQSTCTGQDYISVKDILDETKAQLLAAKVKGKIILIGASAEGLKDLRSTPLQPFRPGVEVHANVIEQVLQGKYLLRPVMTQAAEAAFILAAGLFFILLAPFIGVMVSFLLCLAIIGMAVFGAYSVYVDYGILVDPVYPSLAVLLIFVVSTILSYARAESRRKQIRNAFGMYVAPDVMRDLESNPEKLKLGGELRDLTVMFTDIRKFTSISEGLSPEEIIQMMNEFLTGMTDIVMSHKGTVDKYIGDAMMAFWNAPRDVKYHERLACLAALKMQAALSPMNEKIAARAQATGKQNPVVLNVGIGINTGACAVGNMGSKQRFAYSALGDAVNLSSRLEGQTKYYGVNILMGENTQKECTDLAVLELDLIRVMGKNRPVRIFGLFGDEIFASGEDFRLVSFHHQEFLKLYRGRQFQKALEEIAICKTLSQGRKEGLYAVYEARIHELQKMELPPDWDGVYVAGSK